MEIWIPDHWRWEETKQQYVIKYELTQLINARHASDSKPLLKNIIFSAIFQNAQIINRIDILNIQSKSK